MSIPIDAIVREINRISWDTIPNSRLKQARCPQNSPLGYRVMARGSDSNLSKETRNRILCWRGALLNTCFYLMVERYLRERRSTMEEKCTGTIAGEPASADVVGTACDALIDGAVVMFCQVFTRGNEGYGIAQNRGNREVDRLRDEMKKYATAKLGWSSEDFVRFIEIIRQVRDGFVAHYDGDKANYEERAPGITSMRMVGSAAFRIDTGELASLADVMIEFVHTRLWPPG